MIRTIVFIITFSLCVSAVWAKDEKSIKKLRDALVALAPDVDPGEAELLSVTAHTASRNLAREYHLAWSPIFQNFLITMGKRERGWCGHYTRDIGERLKELKLKTLVLHWGAAFAGTDDESNCLVVTARNQLGATAADYSGAQSKRTMSTTWHRMQRLEGHGRASYFERNAQTINPTITGSRHGKKTRSTPPGYRTTRTLPNGNGKRRHDDFAMGQRALL